MIPVLMVWEPHFEHYEPTKSYITDLFAASQNSLPNTLHLTYMAPSTLTLFSLNINLFYMPMLFHIELNLFKSPLLLSVLLIPWILLISISHIYWVWWLFLCATWLSHRIPIYLVNSVLGVYLRIFLDEINMWICRVS